MTLVHILPSDESNSSPIYNLPFFTLTAGDWHARFHHQAKFIEECNFNDRCAGPTRAISRAIQPDLGARPSAAAHLLVPNPNLMNPRVPSLLTRKFLMRKFKSWVNERLSSWKSLHPPPSVFSLLETNKTWQKRGKWLVKLRLCWFTFPLLESNCILAVLVEVIISVSCVAGCCARAECKWANPLAVKWAVQITSLTDCANAHQLPSLKRLTVLSRYVEPL